MREIDKVNNGIQPIQPAKVDSSKENLKDENVVAENAEPKKEIKDLGNTPAETLGRSQVAADNIENDLKVMKENPKMVEDANKFFDMAEKVLKKNGAEHPAEEAALLTDAYKKEFLTK